MSIMICIIILQLKNLGIIQSVIKSIGSGATSIEAIVSATEGLSLANTAAILTTTGLSEADKIAILMTRGLTEEEAKEALATATLSTSTGVLATIQGKATVATTGFKNALSGLGAVIKANPLLIIVTAATLVVAGLNKIKQSIDETAEELRTKTAESADTLTESLSNLGDYQKRIEELKDAINSDDISQSEATEKRKQLLEIQEELIKKYGKEKEAIDYITESIQGETAALGNLQTIAAQNYLNNNIKQIEEANNYLTKSYEKTAPLPAAGFGEENKSVIDKYKRYTDLIFSQIAPMSEPLYSYPEIDKINGLSFKGTYSELLSQYDETLSNIRKYLSDNPINGNSSDEEKWQAEKLKELESYISGLRSRIDNDEELQKYQKIYNTALDSVLLTSNTYSEYYNKLIEAKNKYTEALTSGNQDEITKSYTELRNLFNEIFNLDFIDEDNVSGESIKAWFEDIQEKINLQSKETPIIVDIQAELKDSSDNGYADKIKALSSSKGYTASDLKSIIAKGDLGEDLGDDKDLYDNIKGYVNLWNDIAQDTGQATITTDEYITALEKVGAIQKEIAEGSESSFVLSKDQTKELKSVHSDVDKLNKAYQNLFAGKLTTNDVVELVDLFPTLGEYVDWTDEKFGNLAEGIDKVIRERPADLIKQLEEIDTSGMSDEAKKAIGSMIAALKQLKPELNDTKTLIEEIQKAIKGVSSSISTLVGFTKEISENGSLSLSSIDTIMTDDTYKSLRPYINDMKGMQTAITELVAKQKDAYEDLYNAEMYENDYEAYHKAVQQKEQENENLLSDSIKQIEDEIKYFNDAYGIDITNWDNLSEIKKATLQNTNAELLSKQGKLIKDFGQLYNDDITNFANATKAKAEIQKHFEESQVYSKINNIIDNDSKSGAFLDKNTGKLKRYASPEAQKKINALLSSYGLTYADYANYRDYGKFTQSGNEALEKVLDEFIKPYTITVNDWGKMTANIKSTGSSGSSSSGSSSSGSSSSSKNYIDWIERRLKKFAQTTKEVFAKVADYISFNGQNSQLRKGINAIHDEITANEQSYQYYMEEANKVGLDPYWQWFVQNGARNISDIQDDALREKVNRYKELYDKATDCKNAVDELRKSEKEYANQMLSNVEKYYSNRIEYANADAEYYNSLDTDNVNLNKNFDAIRKSYNEQISYTQKKHDDLLNTLNSLVSNGSIKYQSDEWYEWWDKIQKCNVEVRNFKKSIHDLANEELQNIQGYWDNRIGAYDNTISYIDTVGGDSTRKGSKDYKGLKNAYNSQIQYTSKQALELQTRLDNAVKAGDIEKYSDKWYEWVGIIEQANNKVATLQTNIHKLADDELQDIQNLWDNRINNANSTAEYFNSADTDNLYINKNFGEIRKSYKEQIADTKEEKQNLIKKLNSSDIEKYSNDWYEWQKKIDACDVSVRNLQKSVRNLANEELQDIQNRWDNRIGAYDNTISYIDTVGGDSTRKGSKDYKGLKNAYNSQIQYTSKQALELQTRLDNAVKAGDIEKYSDKWYEWVGIIEQANNKVAKLQTNIHKLAVDEFNDIVAQYDNLINRIAHKNNLLEESISQTQEKGYIVSTKYYNALITNEQNNISKLSEKRNDLYANLQQAIKSGDIQEGSEEWHKMVQEIENVDSKIEKANTSVIKFNNSIRDIQWQVFDLLQDGISQISAESNFLINLMKNDNLYVKKGQSAGQLTNQGLSTMGLHGVNYNVYMAQSNKYAQEILKIDKQLAKDPYNQTLINRRKELLKLQQDMIISANDEKQAIVSMIKEGIDLELNALKKLIDKYNEALDVQKDLYDYQKRVKEQTKEITSLQKQLMAYTNDSSEETKAKVQQLKVSLETAKENLQETQYDKFISDQKKLLDDLYDDYEKTLNQRLDNVDSLISEMINNINNNAGTIKQTLIDESGSVGYQISSTMNDIWNSDTKPVLSEYNTNFLNTSNNVISAINNLTNSINNMIIALDNTANENTTVKTTSKQPTTTVKQTTSTNSSTNKTNTNNSKNKTNTNSSKNKTNTNSSKNKTNTNSSKNKTNTNSSKNKTNTNNSKSTNGTSSGSGKGSTNNNSTQKNTNHKNTRTDKENYGVALAIINGNYGWGAGEVRKKNLTTKGFNYNAVQGIVNKLWKEGYVKTSAWKGKYYGISDLSPYHYNKYKGSTNNNSTQKNTNHKNTRTDKENYGVALAIINGNYGWGAGEVRKKNLTTKGFNYNTVQGIVNKLWKEGYVKTSAWKGKYYGISDLSPYHYNKYKQGQYSINHNQMAWTNENGNSEVIIRRSDGAILTPLAKDDMVLNGYATDNLFSIANDPSKFIRDNLFGASQYNGTSNINNVNSNYSVSVDTINFNLPNVKNYEDFFYAAQHDKRFEKMVQAMTVDKLFGGSSLKKYRV